MARDKPKRPRRDAVIRPVSDPEKMTSEQKKLLAKIEREHGKLEPLRDRLANQIAARDDAIRAAIEVGVAQVFIAKRLGLTPQMVWKIAEKKTTKELAEAPAKRRKR